MSNIAYEVKKQEDMIDREFWLIEGEELQREIRRQRRIERKTSEARGKFIKENRAHTMMYDGNEILALVMLEGREPKTPGLIPANPKHRIWSRHTPWFTHRGRKYIYWVPGTNSRKKADKDIAKNARKIFSSLDSLDAAKEILRKVDTGLSKIIMLDGRQVLARPQLIKVGPHYYITIAKGDREKEQREIPGCRRVRPAEFFLRVADTEQ